MSFAAKIDVVVRHVRGPEVPPAHVLAWLCSDSQRPIGQTAGFRFNVCTIHASPDDCDAGDEANDAIYEVMIGAASLDEPA